MVMCAQGATRPAISRPLCVSVKQERVVGALYQLHHTLASNHSEAVKLARRGALQVLAATAEHARHHKGTYEKGTYERVLRYPGGLERRIRYPVVKDEDDAPNTLNSYQEDWDPDRWGADQGWDVPGLWTVTRNVTNTRDASTIQSPPSERQSELERKAATLPASPADLLRHLASDSYRQAQRSLWKRIRSSYEVLEGSPWVQSRPVFVLAAQQPDGNAGQTYTLRTRVPRRDMEDELAKVLKRRRPDGRSIISVGELRDGIVMFEDEGDAERYGNLLEADGHAEVMIARCDSHALFRAARDASAVVVLLRHNGPGGGELPMPEQLAVSLRGSRSLEDTVDED